MIQYEGNDTYRVEVGNISGSFKTDDLAEMFSEFAGVEKFNTDVTVEDLNQATHNAYHHGYDEGYLDGCEEYDDMCG